MLDLKSHFCYNKNIIVKGAQIMTSQQLQCFIYVAERLNFTKTAEALYLSVPTVTHHIKNLEEELGIKLFYRNSRIVKLTEQGEKFYYDAKDIYMKMEDAKKRFQNHDKSQCVIFRVGCMSENEFEKIEPILKQIKVLFPYVQPKIIAKDFFDLKNLYENQQLEIAIATGDLSNQGTYKKLFELESYALMPHIHPLANESEISLGQLTEENLIMLSPKNIPFIKGNKLQEFLALHLQDRTHVVSESEKESALLAKCGYGIAVLPGYLVSKSEELVCIPIKGTKNIEYGFYYKSSDKHIKYFLKEYIVASNKCTGI